MNDKHHLVIRNYNDVTGGHDYWWVEHPDTCFIGSTRYYKANGLVPTCDVQFELDAIGIDAFDALPKEPGKWVIKAWQVRSNTFGSGEEYTGGIEILERVE